MNIKICEPSDENFEEYYYLRWKVLRKPWNQPIGSEKDELEKTAYILWYRMEKKLLVELEK